MELGLTGSSALVTGGSKGIGRSVAQALLREGARVVICSRNEKNIAAGKDSPWELYDLEIDRAESRNLAAEKPEKVRELAERWKQQAEDYFALARDGLVVSAYPRGYLVRGPRIPWLPRLRPLVAEPWEVEIIDTTERPATLLSWATQTTQQIPLLFFAAVTLFYISFTPATIEGMGYNGENLVAADQVVTNIFSIVRRQSFVPMEWTRHGGLELVFELPFVFASRIIF